MRGSSASVVRTSSILSTFSSRVASRFIRIIASCQIHFVLAFFAPNLQNLRRNRFSDSGLNLPIFPHIRIR